MVAQHYPNAFISEGEEVPNAPSWLQSIADANKLNKSIESKGDRDMLNSLVLRLGHADSSVRHLAAKCLSNVAVKGDERVLGALLNLGGGAVRRGAEDHDHDVRVASIESAGLLAEGTKNRKVAARLVMLLEERDWSVRQAAVRALVRVGIREDEGLLDRLCNLMGSNKWWAKVMAAEALGSLCEVGNDQVVGALISALGDQDWAVRKAATQALGRLLTEGECKDKVVQAITGRISDCDWRVRKSALETVSRVYIPGSDDVLQAILSRLEDADLRSEPIFLDVTSKGDRDVKTAAIMCLIDLARHREQRVLLPLRGIQQSVTDEMVKGRVDQALREFLE